jgi:hypothetical protein
MLIKTLVRGPGGGGGEEQLLRFNYFFLTYGTGIAQPV